MEGSKEFVVQVQEQIIVLELHVKKKRDELLCSSEKLEFSLISLQQNVDLVAYTLGVNLVWNHDNSKDSIGETNALVISPNKTSSSKVLLQCWIFM